MKKFTFMLIAVLLCVGCSRKLRVNVAVPNYYVARHDLQIIQQGQPLPDNIERIGSVSVHDGGLTPPRNCTYEAVMSVITSEAAKHGAEIVYIVNMYVPGTSMFGSTCYQIDADLYRYVDK